MDVWLDRNISICRSKETINDQDSAVAAQNKLGIYGTYYSLGDPINICLLWRFSPQLSMRVQRGNSLGMAVTQGEGEILNEHQVDR